MIVVDEQNRLVRQLPDHDSSEFEHELSPSEA
jgi:hypothetical protein